MKSQRTCVRQREEHKHYGVFVPVEKERGMLEIYLKIKVHLCT